jgi:predicted DsbA family dithiol-disulfide isomerase
MSKVVIPIYFDYASTLCYVAWRIVNELENELEFTPLWKGVPIRWRDGHSRPGNALGPIERMKVLNVIAETGVQVTPPDRWIDSNAALQGAELAREAQVFAAYHAGVFRAVFEDRIDIGDTNVLAEIAARAGLDGDDFLDGLRSRRMERRIAEHQAEADRFSALGYPAFILGDFPLIGIQPSATMRLLLRRFIEQRTQNPGH